MISISKRLLFLMAIFMILDMSCSTAQKITSTLTSKAIPNQTEPIQTHVVFESNTPFLATITATAVPIRELPTLTPTLGLPTTTLTPVSTLSAIEVQNVFLNLMQTNGNCRLPCIWGLTPGKTDTQSREKLLAKFGKVSRSDFFSVLRDPGQKLPGSVGFTMENNGLQIAIDLNYYEKEGLIEQLTLVTYPTRNLEVAFGDAKFNELIHIYSLAILLSEYGLPTEILVLAWPHDPFVKAPYDPFSIVLVYQELGVMAEYIVPSKRINNHVLGCPTQARVTLRTWSIESDLSLEEIVSRGAIDLGISKNSLSYFKSIEEAASMTIEEFYQVFKNAKETTCLEIIDLWKLDE